MKKSMYRIALLMFVSAGALTSCMSNEDKVERSEEKVEKAEQKLDEAQQEYEENYRNFKAETDDRIKTNDEIIADLKADAKNIKKEARADYDRKVSELEAKNDAMKVRAEAQKDVKHEKWEAFKAEFNHDMDELGESLKDLGKNNVK